MQTESTSEHLFRLKGLIAFIDDPNIRLAIIFAAIEYGHERANAAIESMEGQWQRSIDARLAPPAQPVLLALTPEQLQRLSEGAQSHD